MGCSNDIEDGRPRHIWLPLEASEIIELKRIVLDQDATAAAGFFQEVIAPRVLKIARERGLLLNSDKMAIDGGVHSDGRLFG